MDIIEKILDENNTDDIVITNEETGEEVLFEQIATIPYNDIVYAVLSPKFSNEYFEEGEGVVFKIIKEDDDDVLIIEDNDEINEELQSAFSKDLDEEFMDDMEDDEDYVGDNSDDDFAESYGDGGYDEDEEDEEDYNSDDDDDEY